MEHILVAFIISILILAFLSLFTAPDKGRIAEYFEERGDTVLSISWCPFFGKGWYSEAGKESGNRIYEVEFKDIYGNRKCAWCKTAMFSGVYVSDEVIIEPAQTDGRPLTAEEKVVLLENELRKLRAGKIV